MVADTGHSWSALFTKKRGTRNINSLNGFISNPEPRLPSHAVPHLMILAAMAAQVSVDDWIYRRVCDLPRSSFLLCSFPIPSLFCMIRTELNSGVLYHTDRAFFGQLSFSHGADGQSIISS
jgi:hypothetical protein